MKPRKIFRQIERNIDKNIHNEAKKSAPTLRKMLIDRIKGGTDHKNGQFKPLSKPYERRKKKLGKTAMFEFSGEMLKGLIYRTKKRTDSIVITYTFSKSVINKAEWNSKIRDFFNFSKKEIDYFVKKLTKK